MRYPPHLGPRALHLLNPALNPDHVVAKGILRKDFREVCFITLFCTLQASSRKGRVRNVNVTADMFLSSDKLSLRKPVSNVKLLAAYCSDFRLDGRVVWSVCFWIGRLGVRLRVGSNQ